MHSEDLYYMQMALDLAVKAAGRTSPNPIVGAVVTSNGEVIGRGYHQRAGTPHAEVHALREAGEKARGATLYVTLEPCCHHGRTGPCTEAVIEAGISRVVIAMTDPNPKVAGKGAQRLLDAGLLVECGVLEDRARALNEVFIKYIITGLPFVVLKTAMSLDGKIATSDGESQWITGPQAREHVHRLRDRYDAILVGIGTVLADNPSLTTRLPDGQGRDPVRIILDTQARTPCDARVITGPSPARTIIAVAEGAPQEKIISLQQAGAEVLKLPVGGDGIELETLLRELGRREITGLLVEGGARVNGSFTEKNLVDKVYWYLAPKLIGGVGAPGPVGGVGIKLLQDAPQVDNITVHRLGKDICIEGYIVNRGGSNVHRSG